MFFILFNFLDYDAVYIFFLISQANLLALGGINSLLSMLETREIIGRIGGNKPLSVALREITLSVTPGNCKVSHLRF